MTIREVTLEDYERLFSFWKEHYFVDDIDNKDSFLLFLRKNPDLSILAEEHGEIIGTVLGSFDGRRGYIQKLVIKKELRKKGIGTKLIKETLRRLQALGVMYIPITVDPDIVPFYEQCGFTVTNASAMNISFTDNKGYREYFESKS